MVPCPWFPAAADLQKKNPKMDFGVHLVLTSEWQFYRWRPLTARLTESSLIDDEGYFPRTDSEIREKGDSDEVLFELESQIKRALAFGIDVTHADTHMGAIAHPKFIPGYIQLITQFQLPPLIPRADKETYQSFGVNADTYELIVAMTSYLDAQGIPMVDTAIGLPLDAPDGQLDLLKKMFAALKPGLTHFIIHPSIDTPELRAITPDWPSRVANYKTFLSKELKQFVKDEGIQLIGYREIRDTMRNS